MVKFTGDAWDNQPEPEPVVEEMPEEIAEVDASRGNGRRNAGRRSCHAEEDAS